MSRTLVAAPGSDAAQPRAGEQRSASGASRRSRAVLRWDRVRRWDLATAVLGLSFVVRVGWHGSTPWRITRVAMVVAVTLSALWLEHRRNRALRGASALTVGVVGTSAGLGIGLMHVAKSDLDVIAIAGLTALVTGLYLLVAAAALLIRTTPRWWRLLSVAVVVLVLQFILEPFSIAIYSTNLPSIPLGSATPADRGLADQRVALTSSDGVHLAAWYISSYNGTAVGALSTAPAPRAPRSSARLRFWPVTATESSWSTPGVTDKAAAMPETTGGGVTTTPPVRSVGSRLDPMWWAGRSRLWGCRWAAKKRSVLPVPIPGSKPSSPTARCGGVRWTTGGSPTASAATSSVPL